MAFMSRIMSLEELMSDQTTKKTFVLEGQINLPIRLNMSDVLPSVYAHHVAIQTSADEVVLSFFEVFMPFNISGHEEFEALQKAGVPAECVARVTISKKRFVEFASLFNNIAEQLKEANNAERGEDKEKTD